MNRKRKFRPGRGKKCVDLSITKNAGSDEGNMERDCVAQLKQLPPAALSGLADRYLDKNTEPLQKRRNQDSVLKSDTKPSTSAIGTDAKIKPLPKRKQKESSSNTDLEPSTENIVSADKNTEPLQKRRNQDSVLKSDTKPSTSAIGTDAKIKPLPKRKQKESSSNTDLEPSTENIVSAVAVTEPIHKRKPKDSLSKFVIEPSSTNFISSGQQLCLFKYDLRNRQNLNKRSEELLPESEITEEPYSPAVSEYLPYDTKKASTDCSIQENSRELATDEADTVSVHVNSFSRETSHSLQNDEMSMFYNCKTLVEIALNVLNSQNMSNAQNTNQNKLEKQITTSQLDKNDANKENNEIRQSYAIEENYEVHEALEIEQQQDLQPTTASHSDHNFGENSRCIVQETENVREVVKSRKRSNTTKTNSGKKRTLNKDNWKREVMKKKRNLGEEYVNKKGKVVSEKMMKPGCGYNCVRNCREKISNIERATIFKEFWALGDHNKQIDYICRFVKRVPKKQVIVTANRETPSRRHWSREYYLKTRSDCEVRVCKKMFLDTLAICDMWLNTMFKKLDKSECGVIAPDRRGHHVNRANVIEHGIKESVRNHINDIPTVESHYVRSRTSKLYFEETLSIPKLHNMYEDWMNEKYSGKPKATLRQYRDIFNKDFNIGFHMPKKDQCPRCDIYKRANDMEKKNLEYSHALHIANKEIVRKLKDIDKNESQKSSSTIAACYDLQKILATPQSEVSLFYYKRKFAVYNFTIYEMGKHIGHNYLWNETIGKKGSNEISSFVYDFIQMYVQKGARRFVFYSDSCCGQNKNRMVFAMYSKACKMFNVDITHNFFEVGHSQSEGDAMHALIERRKKNQTVYTPDQWATLIKCAKSTGEPYKLIEVTQELIYDFKKYGQQYPNWSLDTTGQKVLWTKIKHVHFSCAEPHVMHFQYDFFDETNCKIDLLQGSILNSNLGESVARSRGRGRGRGGGRKRGRGRGSHARARGQDSDNAASLGDIDETLDKAYKEMLPITTAKYKDLWSLCTAKAIPDVYHAFYKNLPVAKNDNINESDDNDD